MLKTASPPVLPKRKAARDAGGSNPACAAGGGRPRGTLSPPSAALCAAPPPEGAARGRRRAPPKPVQHALSDAAGGCSTSADGTPRPCLFRERRHGTAAGALFRGRERRRGRKTARDAEPPFRRALRGTSPRGGGERTKARAAEIRPACFWRHTARRACSADADGTVGALFRRHGWYRRRRLFHRRRRHTADTPIPQTRTAHRRRACFANAGGTTAGALFRRRGRAPQARCSTDASTAAGGRPPGR